MQQPPTSTSEQTIQAILDRAHRPAVPIRRSFVQVEQVEIDGRRPPLATMVRHRDERALDFYLLILAQASGGNYDVAHAANVWVRALDLPGKNPTSAVSKVLARLVDYSLVTRDRRGRRAHITLLCEDSSGAPYTHPGTANARYLKLPHTYWTAGWYRSLSLSAKAALLIACSLPSPFFALREHAPKQFGISADTLGDGLHELETCRLLDRWPHYKPAPLTAAGYTMEYRYRLLPPFEKGAHPRPSSAVAASPSSVI